MFQLLGAGLLVVLIALLSTDLLSAMAAQACPSGPDCYPWGAEGPAAGKWSYASKSNYILRGLAQLAALVVPLALLTWRATKKEALSKAERLVSFFMVVAAILLTLA
ncbi:hypothetical protein KUW15_02865 [Qipengyuania aquimaris]|uniref:hypothetical protein n=1 Tax=Qipengyuania aquimaris TaxID=255984 RepID=UPI001C93F984|nr:hypothetical protein [Qipengyuania aquimaris]MBY6127651.1 hypothetical protein [Qipengyuania aquimaris]